jgi:dTDP-3-amino-2,3,6-trideoxy-4-keto-D-glucose/dTDP-3-amino-3,4,6-trideoxy-alpha-D-glucose/dTDP-2,6-dideoxy-D-kanosamine transaminase
VSENSRVAMRVGFSHLSNQFRDIDEVLGKVRDVVLSGDLTLGKPVAVFEQEFAERIGSAHAIGVGSGTDAIKLGLRARGIGYGDEVITAANTFYATVGAIMELGAKPVFVDCDERFCLNVADVEAAITERTTAIVPVHLSGDVADMPAVLAIARHHELAVVEDACQSLLGEWDGKAAGTWGDVGAFSMHPLKIINVWGDAGIAVTDDDELADTLRLLRNHGLRNRDEMEIAGYNSRLDSVQAVVGSWVLAQVNEWLALREANAKYFDAELGQISGITLPRREARARNVFHTYMVFADQRDDLYAFLKEAGIQAKIHYPVPLYRQPALAHLGHVEGAFPVADEQARSVITLPCGPHLDGGNLEYVVECVREFYQTRSTN